MSPFQGQRRNCHVIWLKTAQRFFWILNTLPDAARKNAVQKTVSRQFYEFRVSNIALGASPVFRKPTCHFSQWQQERLKKQENLCLLISFLLLTL